MKHINEVSKLSGVSIRTLRYYDSIGLLKPTEYSVSGYRLYDEKALKRLSDILLFRELQFPLKEIKRILDAPDFDAQSALTQQIELLKLKKEHLENLIDYALKIQSEGVKKLDFKAFDTKKIDDYSKKAKERWGNTEEYREYEKNSADKTADEQNKTTAEFMAHFENFGKLKHKSPDDSEVQKAVKALKDYISEHYYKCSNEILLSLGNMYSADGEFKENIDNYGGDGTALFVSKAIEIYCNENTP